jgi:hypothetical protein
MSTHQHHQHPKMGYDHQQYAYNNSGSAVDHHASPQFRYLEQYDGTKQQQMKRHHQQQLSQSQPNQSSNIANTATYEDRNVDVINYFEQQRRLQQPKYPGYTAVQQPQQTSDQRMNQQSNYLHKPDFLLSSLDRQHEAVMPHSSPSPSPSPSTPKLQFPSTSRFAGKPLPFGGKIIKIQQEPVPHSQSTDLMIAGGNGGGVQHTTIVVAVCIRSNFAAMFYVM